MSSFNKVSKESKLLTLFEELSKCQNCPAMHGPPIHGLPVVSRILLIGQAPGIHEGKLGKPFAWTAGKTLFRWLTMATGASEDVIRSRLYFAAVARCFPGKAGGGDRKPNTAEISNCSRFLIREVEILQPKLLIPVGRLAIERVLGNRVHHLTDVIGKVLKVTYHGVESDVIALPHPSGVSTWHKREPGLSLLNAALNELAHHPNIQSTFETGD